MTNLGGMRPPLARPACRSLMGVKAVGTGSYLPDFVVTNEHLHAKLGFDSDWIVKRTGILERRHAAPHQATSDLCVEAAEDCFRKSGHQASDIDLLVVGTFTPDMSFPSTACLIQDRLGIVGPAIEVEAACAGFMYALTTAAAYIVSGASDRALVIGGDTNSRVLNPDDIKTFPLFGDGAGAMILERGSKDVGILAYSMGSDGSGGPLLHDVDLYVLHQANIRIINAAMDVLHIPRGKVFNNLEKYGNTSGGSIPIALDEAYAEGKLKPGMTVVLCGFGAGLAWGTAVMRV